ncbi:MAG: aspartyl-tRNA amidotransferase subunit B [Deltaproteobacteria bacterium]|jgi:uncharacterized protein YqeY|nr:MAG: aspartyl-tRNA amidotransferase subunit B [Deltaproteobacteria bacterium]
MNLKEKIANDLKEALKNRKEVELSVLRMLQSAIRNKEIEQRKKDGLTDEEVIQVILSEIKKRREAIEGYTKGKRQDLVEREKAELEVLKSYIPKQLEEGEIREEVRKAIDELDIKTSSDFGKLMKTLMPRLKGKAEGSLISKIAKEEIEKLEGKK